MCNNGWNKMIKSGKPPNSATTSNCISNNKLDSDEYDDEETEQIKRAIELSLKTKNDYKSQEEREIEIAIKLSMEYDIMINSTTEFPVISASMVVKTSKHSYSHSTKDNSYKKSKKVSYIR